MSNINEKLHILYISKKETLKELEKINKVIKIKSDKIRDAEMNNKTQRARAIERMRLIVECEQRDRIEKRISMIAEWEEQIKNEV